MSQTSVDVPGMVSDLRMRSRQFSALPGISRADVPPMCPGGRNTCSPGLDGRYGSLVGTPWGEIVPDGIGAFGVVVAGLAAWSSQRTSSRLADIERDRRSTERVPRLSAQLESWAAGQDGFGLSVWLESSEPLAEVRVVVAEARNMDCPIGFAPGQDGVTNELPPALEAEGILPAWSTDTLRPVANWTDRMAPGTSAFWMMEQRRTVKSSAGARGVRFKALAWAERDDQHWELPLPVSVTDAAAARLNRAAAESGR
jgi:hypothetical protein